MWMRLALVAPFAGLLCGCSAFYANSGSNTTVGEISIPAEFGSSATSSIKAMYSLTGASVWTAKDSIVKIEYGNVYTNMFFGGMITKLGEQNLTVVIDPVNESIDDVGKPKDAAGDSEAEDGGGVEIDRGSYGISAEVKKMDELRARRKREDAEYKARCATNDALTASITMKEVEPSHNRLFKAAKRGGSRSGGGGGIDVREALDMVYKDAPPFGSGEELGYGIRVKPIDAPEGDFVEVHAECVHKE